MPPRCSALCPQLFNMYPRLGALLQLHRPVLRKIEEVRAILRALLAVHRASLPRGGPVRSFVDALVQRGQVWTRLTPPLRRPGAIPGCQRQGGSPTSSQKASLSLSPHL